MNNVVAGQSVQAGTSTTSVAPSVDAPANSTVISLLMEATNAAGAFTLSSGGATQIDLYSEGAIVEQILSAYTNPASGATQAVVATAVAAQNSNGLGIQIALPLASVQTGLPIKDGSGNPSRLTYLDSTAKRVTPTKARVFLPGFNSVTSMLAKNGVTWAHRGGSASYPEMSEWAYDQSVLRGYGILEFSAARTSDGWWFGLHDSSTDRTSGGTFGEASAQTKAAVQSQRIVIGATGSPRPYFGLIEFLKKYGKTHVLVLDVKNSASYLSEFLNLIEANVDKSRVIIKFYGVGSGAASIASAAKAKGFKTWGYFYQADYQNGDVAAWQSN